MAKTRIQIPDYGVDITSDDGMAIANLIKGLTKPWTWRERTGFDEFKGPKHIVPAFDPDLKIITEKV